MSKLGAHYLKYLPERFSLSDHNCGHNLLPKLRFTLLYSRQHLQPWCYQHMTEYAGSRDYVGEPVVSVENPTLIPTSH